MFILWNCRALASFSFLSVTHIIHKRLVDVQLSPSQSRAQRSLSPLVTQAKGDRFFDRINQPTNKTKADKSLRAEIS